MSLHHPHLDRPAPYGARNRSRRRSTLGANYVALLSKPQHDPAFDRLAGLARDLLGAPTGLVTIIEAERDRQVFRSIRSIEAGVSDVRQTPLSHSLCRMVMLNNARLKIDDAARDKRFCNHPAYVELGVRAYLGCPIHDRDGRAIGALCVVDREPRNWTDEDVRLLTELAGCADDAIGLVEALDDAESADRDAARAEHARDLFFTGINHEILTELNGVIGLSGLLEETAPDTETLDLARTIGGCGSRLSELIAPILHSSGCGRGSAFPVSGRKPDEVFSEVVEVLSSSGHSSARLVRLEIAQNMPALSAVTSGQMRMILYDLLCDADEAGGCRDIRIFVKDRATLGFAARCESRPNGVWPDDATESAARGEFGFHRIRALAAAIGGTFRACRAAKGGVLLHIDLPLDCSGSQREDARSAA